MFGVNDFESGWVKIPHQDLLALMRVYVQKEEDPNTVTAKGTGRVSPIAQVAAVTGADFADKEIVRDPGDVGYPELLRRESPKQLIQLPLNASESEQLRLGSLEDGYYICLNKLLSLQHYEEDSQELEATFEER